MIFSGIFPRRARTHKKASAGVIALPNPDKTVAFEMDLHVPCRVTGVTRNGSRWEGEAVTISISSFSAHLAVPWAAELDGDVSLIFKVPASLRVLFEKKIFHTMANIKPSGAPGPELSAIKQRIVHVSFAKPIAFRLR